MTVLSPVIPVYTGEPGSTLDWPTGAPFSPTRVAWGAAVNKSAWAAAYTGQTQTISHLADRLRVTLDLPPCAEALAGEREAYFMAVAAGGHWVRLWHFGRPAPLGTLRGTPTVAVSAAAGARYLMLQTTAGATLAAADVLGANSQLIQAAYGGATADGTGLMELPLVLPLRRALAATAALTWAQPTGTFQVLSAEPTFEYVPGGIQQGLQVVLAEVYT